MPVSSQLVSEAERLARVEDYENINALRDPIFNDIAQTIRRQLGAFDAGISVVREKQVRHYFQLLTKTSEVPKQWSFSAHAIHQDKPFVINDLASDERFKDNPFVKSGLSDTGFTMEDGLKRPYRFYAGIPLKSLDGFNIAVLYLLDIKPRELSDLQLEILQTLANFVQSHMNLTMETHLRKKQAERKIQMAEKMAAVGRLTAGIAHDLSTPIQFIANNSKFVAEGLTAIFDFVDQVSQPNADLMLSDNSGMSTQIATLAEKCELSYYRQEMLKALNQSLAGLDGITLMIKSLKKFAHTGKLSESDQSCADINDGILSAIEISRSEWRKNSKLTVDLSRDLPKVTCNLGEILQVLLNIIVNAKDAIQERVKTRQEPDYAGAIHIRSFMERDSAVVHVEDNGGGIPEHVLPKIFDLFFTTKEIGEGSGQGLAICWDIITNRHKGTLTVNTDRTAGTTAFKVSLPVCGV